MSDTEFNLASIEEAPLIDSAQWERLCSELGQDMLGEFAKEFFDETAETWLQDNQDPFALDPKSFRSVAHRTAGAAGTLGFKKVRVAFLCMEHAASPDLCHEFFDRAKTILKETEDWVESNPLS